MKRSATAIGIGLALLIGGAGSLILFPNVVGARTSHAALSQRVAQTSRVQIVQVSAPLASNRDLLTTARARVANRVVQRNRSGSVQRAGRGTARYARTGALYRTGVRYASAMRYGTLYRAATYTGTTRYNTLYRTGTYAGMSYARTGHTCPGMSTRTSTSTSTTTGK
jgi:hypothetical protein